MQLVECILLERGNFEQKKEKEAFEKMEVKFVDFIVGYSSSRDCSNN